MPRRMSASKWEGDWRRVLRLPKNWKLHLTDNRRLLPRWDETFKLNFLSFCLVIFTHTKKCFLLSSSSSVQLTERDFQWSYSNWSNWWYDVQVGAPTRCSRSPPLSPPSPPWGKTQFCVSLRVTGWSSDRTRRFGNINQAGESRWLPSGLAPPTTTMVHQKAAASPAIRPLSTRLWPRFLK